jgi:adenylate cyclase
MIGADVTTIGTEIERKFLLRDTGIVAGLAGIPLLQGYFRDIEGWSVRLRSAAGRAWLTLKSRDAAAPDNRMVRREVESPVDPALADRLLAALPPECCIIKTRYRLPVEDAPGLAWEIDCFGGRHDGLWLAEIELPAADHPLHLPAWLGDEVTTDPRYRNAALAAVSTDGPPVPLPEELDRLARQLLAGADARREAPPSGPSTTVIPVRDRSAGRRAERALRQTRLERELRANLLRRKQQTRGRESEGAEPRPGLDHEDPAT